MSLSALKCEDSLMEYSQTFSLMFSVYAEVQHSLPLLLDASVHGIYESSLFSSS